MGEKGFEDYVRKLCPFYYDFYDVLSVRAGIEPIANSDLLHNSDDSNYNDDNDDVDNDDQCVAQQRTHGGALPPPLLVTMIAMTMIMRTRQTHTQNTAQKLFPIADSSSTGSTHPVTGTNSSLTQIKYY